MEISVETFDKICRVCLIECADMKSLFTKMDDGDRNLFELLAFTANIHVKLEDALPKQVCGECESVMCKADAFKRRCTYSNTILNSIYQNSISNSNATIIDEKCSIKDENDDLTEKLSSYVSFPPCDARNNSSENGFDKKSNLVQDSSIYEAADSSFFNLNSSKAPESSGTTVKQELTLNFNDEIDFADHFDEATESETLPIESKEEPLSNEEKTYTCICGQTFKLKDKYKSHLKLKSCNKYKKIFKNVNKNKLNNIQNEIECIDCNRKFKTMNAWRIHQQVHKNKQVDEKKTPFFTCKFCLWEFKSEATLATHIQKHEKTFDSKTETYQCSFCLRKFKNKTSLAAHIQRHEQTDNIKHVCKICKREFKYKAYLENHVLTMHSKKNGLSCEVCSQNFANEESLELHKDSHKNEKKHQCTVCNKAFVMSCTLKEHMRTHTGEKPFLCSQCGRGFSQKTNLAQHMRRHQGLKPFKCESCEKRFVSKGELDAHNRKHSGAHPFVCDDCGNGFTTSSALVKHRRIHTGEKPYQCDLCPMRFAASGTLKNHRRTHTGERPFQCSYCEKAFVQRNDLISHIRCHTGEKPYICTQCGQSFRKASGLKSHVKMHVKEPGSMLQGVMLNGMQCAEQ
nr:gastrula zinc finger protein XlCGF57.1-like [Helicoverpa armigera]